MCKRRAQVRDRPQFRGRPLDWAGPFLLLRPSAAPPFADLDPVYCRHRRLRRQKQQQKEITGPRQQQQHRSETCAEQLVVVIVEVAVLLLPDAGDQAESWPFVPLLMLAHVGPGTILTPCSSQKHARDGMSSLCCFCSLAAAFSF